MAYLSFSLKYRPTTFEEVVGQQHVTRTLKNALKNDRVAHAYLFTGPRGTGKTTTARILAAALNCVEGPTPEPCGECENCRAIFEDRAMDVREIDAASNRGIDDAKNLRETVKYPPSEAPYKVYILDEAHQLTEAAVNALLKTLEEPPDYVVFLLLTTEPHKILDTIQSRCQRFDFRAIGLSDIIGMLEHIAQSEGVEADEGALAAIARAARGGMRDAESIFDQVVAYADEQITLDIVNQVLGITDRETLIRVTDSIVAGNVGAAFDCVDDAVAEGKDLVRLVEDLTLHLRDLLRLELHVEPPGGLRMSDDVTRDMQAQAEALGEDRLMEAIEKFAEVQGSLKQTSQQGLLLELALAELCRPKVAEAAAQPATSKPAEQPQAEPKPEKTATQQAQPTGSEAPAEVQTAPQPAAEFSLSHIASNWDRVVDEFKAMGHVPASAIVMQARPIAHEDGVLTVAFGPGNEFHYSQFESSYTGLLVEAVEHLYDETVRVRCELFDDLESFEEAFSEAAEGVSHGQAEETGQPQEKTEAAPTEDTTAPPPEPAAVEDVSVAESTGPSGGKEPAKPQAPAEPGEEPADDHEETDNGPMSVDEAVSQTLNLFEGSVEVDDEEDNGT